MRLATLSDVSRIYELCESFYRASSYTFELDQQYGENYIKGHLTHPTCLSLLHESDQGTIEGCLLAVVSPHPFLPLKVANELVWWIEPQYRSRHSTKLLEAYEYWAIEVQKADLVCVTSTDDPRLEKYYKRKGYTVKEHTWYLQKDRM